MQGTPHNLQGDVLSVVDSATGQTAVSYKYDAWGKLLSKSSTSTDYATIYEFNPLTYRGYIYDSETVFYYLQSRYYDPAVGRFLNADEATYLMNCDRTIGWNLFAYCNNDVVNAVDYYGYETVSLLHTFNRIYDGKNYFYGGKQSWWDKDTFRWLFISVKKKKVGCGPTAAANIIAYLAKYHLTKLTKRNTTAQSGFLDLMNDVFDYVKPGVLGLWWLSSFTSGVEKYAKSKGVSLKGYWSNKSATYNNAIDYIKEGLRRDCPVALIIHFNNTAKYKLITNNTGNLKQYQNSNNHWVVITKITDTKVNGKRQVVLTVSTWGEEAEINFDDIYYYSSYWGLMYFKW